MTWILGQSATPGLRQAHDWLRHVEASHDLAAQAQLHALLGGLLQAKDGLSGSQVEDRHDRDDGFQ